MTIRARTGSEWAGTPYARVAGAWVPLEADEPPGAVNLMQNPAAAVDLAGWQNSAASRVRVTDLVGTPRATGVQTTGSGLLWTPDAPVTPGAQYMVSFYAVNRTGDFRFGRDLYIGYRRSVGGDTFPEQTSHAMGAIDEVSRFSRLTAPAPANATALFLLWDSLWVDSVMTCVMVDPSGTLNDYEDPA
jgi:hypothetical protein